ncbi:tetratricopeptide repeat protein [uncultured Psychroserpens sp.]|uniref:tetratricopeptide repeat protein n=1 Tax=uncultured Psychroserpens sp. TaxID=255436 RepID=UPI00260BE786|nr:tetratricopeptide repeat protein [uncultured Psychroserpens sp.]
MIRLHNLTRIISLLVCFVCGLSFSQNNTEEAHLRQKANDLYISNSFSEAAKVYVTLFELNPKKEFYLYNASACAIAAKDYQHALDLYLKLKALGYTGVKTQYFAINKKTKKEELFTLKERDSLVSLRLYKKPSDRKTESKVDEINKNIVLIYINLNLLEKALEAVKEARQANSKDLDLIISEASVHYKLNNIEKFKECLEDVIKKAPKNTDALYNLGVIAAEEKLFKVAKKYYKKVIKFDPNYTNAYINLATIILKDDISFVDEMNALGLTKADDRRYDILVKKRNKMYRKAMPILETILAIDSDNTEVKTTLKNIYSKLDYHAKARAIKM